MKFAPMELSSQRIACTISSASAIVGRVERRGDVVAVDVLVATAERVVQGREDPAAGVRRRHLGVSGDAGGIRDRFGVLADLVPRGRRCIGVEPRGLEERAVVVEALPVGGDRHRPQVAVGVLAGDRDVRVVVVGVGELGDQVGDVGDLLALDEPASVGERAA